MQNGLLKVIQDTALESETSIPTQVVAFAKENQVDWIRFWKRESSLAFKRDLGVPPDLVDSQGEHLQKVIKKVSFLLHQLLNPTLFCKISHLNANVMS